MTPASRERTLKIILVVLGIVQFGTSLWSFVGAWGRLPRSVTTPMLESVMMTLGVFLVLASRNPPALSQPDPVRRVGEPRACDGNGGDGDPGCDAAGRAADPCSAGRDRWSAAAGVCPAHR